MRVVNVTGKQKQSKEIGGYVGIALLIVCCVLAYVLIPREKSGAEATPTPQATVEATPAATPCPYPREEEVLLSLAYSGISCQKAEEAHTYNVQTAPKGEAYSCSLSIKDGTVRAISLMLPGLPSIQLGENPIGIEIDVYEKVEARRKAQNADCEKLISAIWDALLAPDVLPASFKLRCTQLTLQAKPEPADDSWDNAVFSVYQTEAGDRVLSLSLS